MAGYAQAAADLNLAVAERDRGRRRAAVPRLAAAHQPAVGGRARRRDVGRRPRRALAARAVRPGRGDHRAARVGAGRPRPDRLRRPRVQQARGGRLPQLPARRLPRPADRGARPGRGPRRAADRHGPGGRGDHRGREHLPGLPRRVRRAAADHRARDHRRLPAVPAGHLVARGRARARTAAGRARLACPRVRGRVRHQRHPGGGAHLRHRVRLHHRPARPRQPPSRTRSAPPTPPCSSSGWSASTRRTRCARSGCTPAFAPRSAPTWHRAASTRSCRRRRPRCSRPGRRPGRPPS